MKIAFLTSRFDRPSYRYRVGQFLPYLERNAVVCRSFVIPRSAPARAALFLGLRRFDAVFLQKRMLRPFDRLLLRAAARRLAYDVDDAVMFREGDAAEEPRGARMRRFRAMVRMSDRVLAGNEMIRRQAGGNAILFPTVVDTDRFTPPERDPRAVPVVGWSGSRSTNPYLNAVLPPLERLARSVRFTLRVVSDTREGIALARHPGIRAEFAPWSAASEQEEFRGFDVGIMPLPDTPWARGKCALKALVYMACGAAAVCSPVGVAAGLIASGENGFLASSEAEWRDALERLLLDAALRERIAARARATVVERYSLAAQAPKFLAVLQDLCGGEGA